MHSSSPHRDIGQQMKSCITLSKVGTVIVCNLKNTVYSQTEARAALEENSSGI